MTPPNWEMTKARWERACRVVRANVDDVGVDADVGGGGTEIEVGIGIYGMVGDGEGTGGT